jgi:chromate transport protein ChrA
MGYIKWVDGLTKGLKVLLTIFANPIFAAYRIVREAFAKNWNLMVWDIVFTVVWPVNWVMDLITILGTGEPFNYAAWFGATGEGKSEAKPAEEKKADEKPAEEKKDDTAAK